MFSITPWKVNNASWFYSITIKQHTCVLTVKYNSGTYRRDSFLQSYIPGLQIQLLSFSVSLSSVWRMLILVVLKHCTFIVPLSMSTMESLNLFYWMKWILILKYKIFPNTSLCVLQEHTLYLINFVVFTANILFSVNCI